jgi:hypothetical protein
VGFIRSSKRDLLRTTEQNFLDEALSLGVSMIEFERAKDKTERLIIN